MNEFYKDLLSQNRNIEKIEEMTIKNASQTLKLTFRRIKIYIVVMGDYRLLGIDTTRYQA